METKVERVKKTKEQRLEEDRIRHKKRYDENPEQARKIALERYYKRKERDPNFHSKPTGRPKKVSQETPTPVQ